MEETRLPLLEQREIEARIVGPLIRAFAEELGAERALAIVARVIRGLARQSGAELAQLLGEQTLDAFARTLDRWRENGALELDILEQSPGRLSFNVTRCRYAEMYRALGLADLGASLSCQRDYALAQGFNPDIELTRTQTIMEGALFCDFRFRLAAATPPAVEAAAQDQPDRTPGGRNQESPIGDSGPENR
ncbi:MAG TPA: L-2-amino-thiazoline-4-carboxylic acid hydrolase [Isosphaeraceae bacterium]|nr:L-2-amino-thiazoline-4-carboxylic acid hydrolase [Isosphaeraceae bacterium]